MAPLIHTLLALSLAAFTCASPLPSSASLFGRAGAAASPKIYTSDLHYIFPQSADSTGSSTHDLHLEAFDGKSYVEQIAVFTGIPAEAKTCTIGWSQTDKLDRIFLVKGNALTDLRPLSGFPQGDVTYNNIKAFDDGKSNRGVDFTNWDGANYTKQDHIGGPVPCASEIYVRVSLRDVTAESSLFFAGGEGNGLFISYTV